VYLSDCVAGNTFNAVTGKAPCDACDTCRAKGGVKAACTATTNTVCNGGGGAAASAVSAGTVAASTTVLLVVTVLTLLQLA
jgi:hypothetical protein